MKNLDLNKFGVQEMNAQELNNVDGGNQPIATYMTDAQIAAAGNAIRTAVGSVVGFINGFFGF